MPRWLEAVQVILRLSFDSNRLFFGAAASVMTTLAIVGGMGATTVNVPLLVELTPFKSVDLIVYV